MVEGACVIVMEHMSMILFGTSNILSDIYDCSKALHKEIRAIILNVPEEVDSRSKGLQTRLGELGEHPLIIALEDFVPANGEEYFIVPTTPRRSLLVEYLRGKYQLRFTQLIHPTAYVSPYARIGEGVYVGARSTIAPGVVLKEHVFVNRAVSIGHDTVVHEYARVQPGSNIAGLTEIGRGVTVGIGATVIEKLVIGEGATIAAGAVVLHDVEERTLVADIPAVAKKSLQRETAAMR